MSDCLVYRRPGISNEDEVELENNSGKPLGFDPSEKAGTCRKIGRVTPKV
jgi:hypothetical protein